MVIAAVVFQKPVALAVGVPMALALIGWAAWLLRRRGISAGRIAVLYLLRGVAMVGLVLLLARPVWVARDRLEGQRRPVAVLLDRSESMSLEEGHETRYARSLGFARDHLLPALKSADLPVQAMLFADDAVIADGEKLAGAKADGRRSNLGGAIARAMTTIAPPPLAVIALTDGAANERAENSRALSGLIDARAPFIGVGFGSDTAVQTISLRRVDAPQVVAPRNEFAVSAQLEVVNATDVPEIDLVLYRDGKFAQKKTVAASKGSRFWMESFRMMEPQVGVH